MEAEDSTRAAPYQDFLAVLRTRIAELGAASIWRASSTVLGPATTTDLPDRLAVIAPLRTLAEKLGWMHAQHVNGRIVRSWRRTDRHFHG